MTVADNQKTDFFHNKIKNSFQLKIKKYETNSILNM